MTAGGLAGPVVAGRSLLGAPLIGLALWASAGLAADLQGPGYVLGCGEGGCMVFAQGMTLHVADDGSTPGRIIRAMDQMAPVTAVDLAGDLGPPDPSGPGPVEIRLSRLTLRPQDPYQDRLRLMQGNWTAGGLDGATEVQIEGLHWQEMRYGEAALDALITPGSGCDAGSLPGGMVLSLTSSLGAGACWQVESLSDSEMTLRDIQGAQGEVIFRRGAE